MKKAIAKIGALTAVAVSLSGCVGSNAVTGYVMGFNLKAVDNRYARGGLNMLLAPVYGVAIAADYIVFNSLEFWTGKNPLNGKPHIFDTKMDTYIDVNHQLDKSLTTAPIAPLANNRVIEQVECSKSMRILFKWILLTITARRRHSWVCAMVSLLLTTLMAKSLHKPQWMS